MEDNNKIQTIDTQAVRITITEMYCRNLLSMNELATKEERLMGLLMGCVDGDGVVEVMPASRDRLCGIVGLTNGMWRLYLSKWRKAGIITTSGHYITFTKFLKPNMQGLLILSNYTNGMGV